MLILCEMNEQIEVIKKMLFDSCRATADYSANVLLKKPELLQIFETMAFSDEYPFDMRASNVIEKADDLRPGFARQLIPKIIRHLTVFKNDGPRRQFLRMLSRYVDEMDENDTGLLYDVCFAFVCDKAQPVAVRHNALLVIESICRRYPDLKNEICSALRLRINEESGAFGNWVKAFTNADFNAIVKK
jgi:hypothetical protein